MDTVESLNKRLAKIAKKRALEMEFSPGCKRLVFRRIEYAAHQIASKELLSDQTKIEIAETNIDKFISEMMVEARRRGYGSMHEDVFAATMQNICPLWPIC